MIETVQDVVGVGPAIVNAAASAVKDHVAPLPFAAPPKSIFNVPITGARRVAAQSWPIERLRKVSCVADVTLNDAVLAMCAGALRRYLIELDELPDKPLIAMVPVSLRKGEEGEASGNAVGAVLCDLATELVDPAARLQRVHDSMSSAKSLMSGLTPLQITALSALNVAGLGLPLIPGSSRLITGRPVFNLVISNVPRPDNDALLEWRETRELLPGIDSVGRAGDEHHRHRLRGHHAVRARRLPPQCSALAAAPRPSRGILE